MDAPTPLTHGAETGVITVVDFVPSSAGASRPDGPPSAGPYQAWPLRATACGGAGLDEDLPPGGSLHHRMHGLRLAGPSSSLSLNSQDSVFQSCREQAMGNDIARVGLDIAKSVFQVHATDAAGRVVCRKTLRRDQMEPFFRALPSCVIGLEACPGSHHWARLLRGLGHTVKILPAQYVRPYVKTNKNDAADAEAICEAMTRPTMRFVPIKEERQQEILVFHRVREMLMRQRVQLINSIRGHLAEFGIVGPERAHNVGLLTAMIEDANDPRVPTVVRRALLHLVAALREVNEKLERINEDLTRVARSVEICRRLMTIPGVGVVTATALVASMRDPKDFQSGRHFAAWLGLVPRQNSTGGVDKLGGISKRGDGYLRRLLIHGSRSVMRWRSKTWTWLAKLRKRRPANVAAVAVANKMARVVWALLRYGGTYGSPAPRVA